MINLLELRQAIEESWDEKTSYLNVKQDGNQALGQCYPTSWLIQQYFPEMEIIKGTVISDSKEDIHFWNILKVNEIEYHIDLTWQQFPVGAHVKSYSILDRKKLGDGPETIKRCEILSRRVKAHLQKIQ